MAARNAIASFAVLDLETNNLPEYNFNKVNITEIAIHGFSAENIRNATNCNIPRVNHKLTLLFNPLMMIHERAEEITGLNNEILEHESSFDVNAANGIISFLKHLRQPICLVAHNGNKFDFPILKHAFNKLNMTLPSDVLCIDTLQAIKELDRLAEEKEEIPYSQEKYDPLIPLPNVDEAVIVISDSEEKEEKNVIDRKKLNETTPKRPPNPLQALRKRRTANINKDETTPRENNVTPRRSLFKETKPKKRYNLASIYQRLFDEAPAVAHHAEADVISLEKVMLRYGADFVEYAEAKAKPFADTKKIGAC